MPKITVLMPVYNGEKYIIPAIDSILNQTFTDFEFLIIDDGSTDKTPEIIQSYNDARIVYVRNEKNSGVSYSANRGLFLAKGDYIARMDADDIAFSNRLERQLAFMENNKDVVLCSSEVLYVNDDNINEKKIKKLKTPLPAEWLILFGNPIAQPAIFFRKNTFTEKKWYYDEKIKLGEDYELWTTIITTSKIFVTPETLLYYREHNTSAFHANEEKSYANSKISNEALVKNLTNTDAPFFHTFLTPYCSKNDYPTTFIPIKDIIAWLDKLVEILSKKWDWDSKTQKLVKKDYAKRIDVYARKLSKKIRIQNLFKFRELGLSYYLLILKKVVLNER